MQLLRRDWKIPEEILLTRDKKKKIRSENFLNSAIRFIQSLQMLR